MAKMKNNFSSIVGGLSSLTMGFSMATNAAKSFFSSLAEGDLDVSTVISSLSTYLMGLMQMVGPIM
jgi:hypothetical protein